MTVPVSPGGPDAPNLCDLSQEESLHKALPVLVIISLIALLCACSSGNHQHTAYVTLPSSNAVAGYYVDDHNGTFTPMPKSPYTAGSGPSSVVVHPSNKFVYASNAVENTISLFTADPKSGALTEALPRTPTGAQPLHLAMTSDGSLIFCSNTAGNNISVYSVNSSTGVLTLAPGSPVTTFSPASLLVSRSGSTLYVANSNSSRISAFTYSSSGALTPVAGSPFAAGPDPSGLATDPGGKFLYAANLDGTTFSGFTIGSGGVLTPMSGSPFELTLGTTNISLSTPVSMVVDLSGKYLYAVAVNPLNIYGYTIDPNTGLPAMLTGSPFASSGTGPGCAVPDTKGEFIYVCNQTSNSIALFEVNTSSGALTTPAATSTITGPTSLFVTP
jgi:6-phosphogluconolactonase (cycloisomerase 2 family)